MGIGKLRDFIKQFVFRLHLFACMRCHELRLAERDAQDDDAIFMAKQVGRPSISADGL